MMFAPLTLLTAATLTAAADLPAPSAIVPLRPVHNLSATYRLGYTPRGIQLSDQKPSGVRKEPTYTAAPKYGVLRVGNGPRADHAVAVDEPQGGEPRIFVDLNANGDLTDDGDGAWAKRTKGTAREMYGVQSVEVRASYGNAEKESGSAPYQISLYRFPETKVIQYYRNSGRVGTLKLGDKEHEVLVVENEADGVFSKPGYDSPPAGVSSAIHLYLDLKPTAPAPAAVPAPAAAAGNAEPKPKPDPAAVRAALTRILTRPTAIDIRAPFELNGQVYESGLNADGTELRLYRSEKLAYKPKPATVERPPLLATGVEAPDFTAVALDGKAVKLSDFRGKVVILDFWATWCGPCLKAMPHLEELYREIRGRKDVVILPVCVSDTKDKFEEFVDKNRETYTMPFVFDPAGRDSTKSISRNLYKVSGIPTTYIVDKDGKVSTSFVGYREGDKRVEEAVKALGIELAR